MANPQGPGTGGRPSKQQQGTLRPEQPGSDEDQARQATAQRRRTAKTDRDDDADRKAADRVEIGDPVPESDRTITADRGDSTRARGETGEDEDLPDDDGNVEGTRDGRH